MYKGRSLT